MLQLAARRFFSTTRRRYLFSFYQVGRSAQARWTPGLPWSALSSFACTRIVSVLCVSRTRSLYADGDEGRTFCVLLALAPRTGVAGNTALRPRVHVVQVELHTPDSPRVVTICADSRPERCTQLITDRVARVADPSSVVIRVYESVYEN